MERRFTPAKLVVVACSVVLVAGYVWWRSGGREDMRIFSSSKSARLSRMQIEPPGSPGAGPTASEPPAVMWSTKSAPVDAPTTLPSLITSSKSGTVLAPGQEPASDDPANRPPALMAHACSNNHDGDGQNIAYTDAHVEWFNTPFSSTQPATGPSTQPTLLPLDDDEP